MGQQTNIHFSFFFYIFHSVSSQNVFAFIIIIANAVILEEPKHSEMHKHLMICNKIFADALAIGSGPKIAKKIDGIYLNEYERWTHLYTIYFHISSSIFAIWISVCPQKIPFEFETKFIEKKIDINPLIALAQKHMLRQIKNLFSYFRQEQTVVFLYFDPKWNSFFFWYVPHSECLLSVNVERKWTNVINCQRLAWNFSLQLWIEGKLSESFQCFNWF